MMMLVTLFDIGGVYDPPGESFLIIMRRMFVTPESAWCACIFWSSGIWWQCLPALADSQEADVKEKITCWRCREHPCFLVRFWLQFIFILIFFLSSFDFMLVYTNLLQCIFLRCPKSLMERGLHMCPCMWIFSRVGLEANAVCHPWPPRLLLSCPGLLSVPFVYQARTYPRIFALALLSAWSALLSDIHLTCFLKSFRFSLKYLLFGEDF